MHNLEIVWLVLKNLNTYEHVNLFYYYNFLKATTISKCCLVFSMNHARKPSWGECRCDYIDSVILPERARWLEHESRVSCWMWFATETVLRATSGSSRCLRTKDPPTFFSLPSVIGGGVAYRTLWNKKSSCVTCANSVTCGVNISHHFVHLPPFCSDFFRNNL